MPRCPLRLLEVSSKAPPLRVVFDPTSPFLSLHKGSSEVAKSTPPRDSYFCTKFNLTSFYLIFVHPSKVALEKTGCLCFCGVGSSNLHGPLVCHFLVSSSSLVPSHGMEGTNARQNTTPHNRGASEMQILSVKTVLKFFHTKFGQFGELPCLATDFNCLNCFMIRKVNACRFSWPICWACLIWSVPFDPHWFWPSRANENVSIVWLASYVPRLWLSFRDKKILSTFVHCVALPISMPPHMINAVGSCPQSNSCSVDTCCCLIEIIYLEPLIQCLVQKNVAGVGGKCSRQWTSIAVHKSIKSNKSIGSTTESIKYSLDVLFHSILSIKAVKITQFSGL